MKKIFTSALLMMLGIIGMNAQTTVYSWESPEGTPIETGGTIVSVNGTENRVNYKNGDYYTICLNGKKANVNDEAPSSSASKMVLTLDQALQAGDVISMTAYINKDATGKKASAYLLFETGAEAESAIFSDESNIHEVAGGKPTTQTIEVSEAAAGSKVITMTRSKADTNLFIIKLTITRSKSDVVDCTSYIVNADLTGNDGWNIEGTKGYHSVGGVVTAGNNAQFNFCQTIKNLPAGQYKLTAQAAYRFSSSEADEAAAIAAGTNTKLATLYATVGTKTVSEKVMNRWDGASDTDYANNDGSTTVNGKFVPNSTAAMKAWFTNGQYVNEVVFNLTEDGDVTIGIEKTAQPDAGDYTVIGPWTLTRLGDAEQVAEPITVTFDFSDPNFRKDIGESMADTKGYIYNETFPVDGVTLQITAGSAPSRIFVDSNRGQNIVTYKEYTTLTFRAPEGKAITEIEFVAAGNSNINNFAASSGTIEGMKWTGNADGVRFQQGGTSYLAKAIVKLEDKTDETGALLAMPYVACENIAAFNALDNGTYAKVMLKDAELTGISADGYSTMWIQDATGGCWIQYSTLINKLKEGNKVNGFFFVVKRTASGNPQMKEAEDTPESEFTLEPISSYTMVEGTIAEVNVAANLSRVVKITNAEFAATSATQGKLTQGEASITVNNGTETANQQMHKITDVWVKDETKMADVTIVAILAATSATDATKNQLYPISMEGTVVTGIQNVEAAAAEKYTIFNLQGQRMEQVQKGLYIVNGKKVVLK